MEEKDPIPRLEKYMLENQVMTQDEIDNSMRKLMLSLKKPLILRRPVNSQMYHPLSKMFTPI